MWNRAKRTSGEDTTRDRHEQYDMLQSGANELHSQRNLENKMSLLFISGDILYLFIFLSLEP